MEDALLNLLINKLNYKLDNMNFIKQARDVFIRRYGNIGYITNQRTKRDLYFNETGADFLDQISRETKSIETIVISLLQDYEDISYDELKNDFIDFIVNLERQDFVIIGECHEDIVSKEQSMCLKNEDTKTTLEYLPNPHKMDDLTDFGSCLTEKFHEIPRIFGLQIEVSSRCNERCIHCYLPNKEKEQGKNIDLDLILRVLDEAKEMGTLSLTLSGGELFMHKNIDVILRHARKNDFSISILSNLVLLNNDNIELLKEINPSLIQVSLYSMIPEEHDAITLINGSFKKTKANIERLVESRLPIQISCPVMKINYKSYKDVLMYSKKIGVIAHTDFIMMAQSNFDKINLKQRLNIKEIENLLEDVIRYDDFYTKTTIRHKSKIKDIEQYKKLPVCGVAVDGMCLAANGDYYPCSGWHGMVLGNAYKQNIKDVWDNSKKLKDLRTITKGSFMDCITCEAKEYCDMCMVRNFNESNGDMFKINKHFCDVAFLNKKIIENFLVKNIPNLT